MTEINWNLLQVPDIGGNALAAFERGQQIGRQRKAEEAWGAYAANPNEQNLNALAAYDPKAAIGLRQDMEKRQQQAQAQDLQRRAAAGDTAAMAQLSGIDLDAWSKLDTQQRTVAKQRAEYIGNSALAISRLPPQQQAAAWDAAIDQGVQLGMTELAAQRGKYSPQGLQAAISGAGMMSKFIDMTEPKYQVVPQGGTMVNTNDPAAIKQFQGQQTGGAGLPRVSTPDEARKLPPGTKFLMPDGRIGTVPGGASGNAGGNFRPVNNAGTIAQSLFPGVRVTQVRRDPNSGLGRANPNSWHNRSGGAVDVAPIPNMTFDQYVQAYRNAGYNIIEARDEVNNPSRHATGPHWHIVLGERN